MALWRISELVELWSCGLAGHIWTCACADELGMTIVNEDREFGWIDDRREREPGIVPKLQWQEWAIVRVGGKEREGKEGAWIFPVAYLKMTSFRGCKLINIYLALFSVCYGWVFGSSHLSSGFAPSSFCNCIISSTRECGHEKYPISTISYHRNNHGKGIINTETNEYSSS